jgi:protein-S-isoprenylcysteine O-methyltransferase Ste14
VQDENVPGLNLVIVVTCDWKTADQQADKNWYDIISLMNVDRWFIDPLSAHQIISWILIIHGAVLLRKIGKPDNRRDDASLLGLEKTTKLVVEGAYRTIRHPFYSPLLFLGWERLYRVHAENEDVHPVCALGK